MYNNVQNNNSMNLAKLNHIVIFLSYHSHKSNVYEYFSLMDYEGITLEL